MRSLCVLVGEPPAEGVRMDSTDKARAEQAEKDARTSRNVSIASAAFAGMALIANIGIAQSGQQLTAKTTAGSALVTSANNEVSQCLSWVSLVRQEQREGATAGRPPSDVDAGIDRMGQVVLTLVTADTQFALNVTKAALDGKPAPPDPTGAPDPKSVAAHCGSAHDIRIADTTTDPVELHSNPRG